MRFDVIIDVINDEIQKIGFRSLYEILISIDETFREISNGFRSLYEIQHYRDDTI